MKPLNQNNYRCKILQDLGVLKPEGIKNATRYVLLECPECTTEFTANSGNGRKMTKCKDCSKKAADILKRKPVDWASFNMKVLKDIRGTRKSYFLVECSQCVKPIEVRLDRLQAGQAICDDCNKANISTQNGDSGSKLYAVWNGMMQRCYMKTRKDYPRYGGVGVTVSKEFHNFLTFRDFCLSSGWGEGLHVDKDKLCKAKSITPHYYSRNTISFITASENSRIALGREVVQISAVDGSMLRSFRSAIEAAEYIGKTSGDNITSACRNRKVTAFGYKWAYK